MLKQYFTQNLIHFDIDIVLMFYKALPDDQKENFVEDRISLIKEKIETIKHKIEEEKKLPADKSYLNILTYLEHHLKAEYSWLKILKK